LKKTYIHIVTFVLLLCISINAILYNVYFNFEEINLKVAAHQLLSDKAELITIKIPLAKFDKNNTDEILYKNNLYDIASYSISNDSVSVLVYHDEKEETLFASNAEHFKHDNDISENWSGNHLNKKSSTVPVNYNFFSVLSNYYSAGLKSAKIFLPSNNHLLHISIKVFFPPPDGLSC